MAYMRTKKPLEEKKMMKTATPRVAKPKGELNRGQGVTPRNQSNSISKKAYTAKTAVRAGTSAVKKAGSRVKDTLQTKKK